MVGLLHAMAFMMLLLVAESYETINHAISHQVRRQVIFSVFGGWQNDF